MDFVGTSLSAAQTLLTTLRCAQLKYIPEIIGLQRTKHTVETVTAVLRDAERKQNELTNETRIQIKELKDAVFDAEDLLDGLVTLAEQNRILKVEGRLSQKISNFLSRSKALKGVKEIRKKLDVIVNNEQFNIEHDPEPIRRFCRETISYVDEDDIIGRNDERKNIVSMMLDHSNIECDDVSFLSVVGIGGLGKTTLAQLVFNDERVLRAFSLRIWVCVADQDQKQFNVKTILAMILQSATDERIDQGSTFDQIQNQLLHIFRYNRYLLVLDDVWTEDRNQWCELVKYLIGGQRGSWVVVTTRSPNTATIIQGQEYRLQSLSLDKSWCLFKQMAFRNHQFNPPDDLVDIGRKIVDGCAGLPLAIKVAGSLVRGQKKSMWLSVRNNMHGPKGSETENSMMTILKLSYDQLSPALKCCFNYCALFPKDYQMNKEMLISLWVAQGYINDPLDDSGQSIGDNAEKYFLILSKRCFFQVIRTDGTGEILSCKLHDLMHDLAQSMSGNEIYALNSSNSANLDNIKVRHLSIAGARENGKYPLGITHIRSYLFVDGTDYPNHGSQSLVEALLADCRLLRALDLSGLNIEILPRSISGLLHLRYLDLSFNQKLELLPKSITKICNLQTLKLSWCSRLKELPKDFNRLVNLRELDIDQCEGLQYMPRGMGKLSNLERLKGEYILGGEGKNCSSWEEWFYGLEDLNTLNKLKGQLKIKIKWPENAVKEKDSWSKRVGFKSCLKAMKHLNSLILHLENGVNCDGTIMELLMEELQPHSNLKSLHLLEYTGVKMPSWLGNATSLPHLVSLHLEDFEELEYLPLSLPSFTEIYLKNMPKLRRVGVEESSDSTELQQLLLPCLSKLTIFGCPKLTCLGIMAPQLREVTVGEVGWKDSVPMESFKSIRRLSIEFDYMVDLPNWIQYCSALQQLEVSWCPNLQSIPKWMPQKPRETMPTRSTWGGLALHPMNPPLNYLSLHSRLERNKGRK